MMMALIKKLIAIFFFRDMINEGLPLRRGDTADGYV